MRRKPDGDQRRRDLCDAAITVLAAQGAKGLSHIKVDREAGVAHGTTSAYFRTRSALLVATTERVIELDRMALQTATSAAAGEDQELPRLADVLAAAAHEPWLTRAKARYELTMLATREPAIHDLVQRANEGFAELFGDMMLRLLPSELPPSAVDDLSAITQTFISGLLGRYAINDFSISDPDEIDRLIRRIVAPQDYS
ncbi:DNA-binding transcriptional regulator YbjK [Mycolicibacterium sp. BK556]|uniref:TetR/AcrR family transcriptional regulator n=1 Tax=Mycobacteriaceae TaxID=1762 RepID=UPI00105F6541|nr:MULTISPECIES: TetR family transcriptional regulator [Mycobacteriaceae]MBB3601509.1 DNA-binding transcriptional regulator YbjK [Mycolicibacterium sp. BK556]MBB3631261.1 DNA-binding transcriptional regulator YbjK [Mycolicibacterium sp. BK607]MBB3749265.1 DNA-binding transcriptional regulator YbjK [Mycolicibacterium sp. BK634]TDO14517.1 TetR family transcriptional regulator [Mycobacterium sp. BK086]